MSEQEPGTIRMSDVQANRLRTELMHITKHPEVWVQGVWAGTTDEDGAAEQPPEQRAEVCGTVACLAGNLAISAGLVSWERRGDNFEQVQHVDRARELGLDQWVSNFSIEWAQVGSRLIGYQPYDSYDDGGPGRLFRGGNTLEDLWATAEAISDGRVTLPAELADRVAEIDRQRAVYMGEGDEDDED